MIDAKNAVQIAKQQAAGMLDQGSTSLEEIEREVYKDREVWSITLGFPRNPLYQAVSPMLRVGMDAMQYKRFLIDVETGELIAIKLREIAFQ
jgi:hypothetical protein